MMRYVRIAQNVVRGDSEAHAMVIVTLSVTIALPQHARGKKYSWNRDVKRTTTLGVLLARGVD
jgi:hypothetical protein